MRHDRGVLRLLGHLDGFQGLGERAAILVDLDQDGVGDLPVDAFLQDLRVGDEQVIAHELYPAGELVGEPLPAVPVALGHSVLDGDDGVARGKAGKVIGEARRIETAALAFQVGTCASLKNSLLATSSPR